MKGIVVLAVGMGVILLGVIIFIVSMLYQSFVGKKIIRELFDNYNIDK